MSVELMNKVNNALESIRPHLAADGGNIEVVEITEDFVAKIKWVGTCETCSMSMMTMKAGVEHTIRSVVPEIKAVKAVNGLFMEE